MATSNILDADMATVTGWIRSGFAWWVDELRSIMPFAFNARETVARDYVFYGQDGSVTVYGYGRPEAILVDPALCLVRHISLPALGDADLARVVALDADRIMPISPDLLVIAARTVPDDRNMVIVAGLRRLAVTQMLDAVKSTSGTIPQRIGLFDPETPGRIAVDFTQACAEAGLIAPVRRVAAGWWAAVAFLFALNIGTLVWRDAESLRNMEVLIAAQAPAVNAARTIAKRISNTQKSAESLANRRSRQNILAVMAAVTQALPERAWVQRFEWDGREIRLSGYKREGADVVGALRKSTYFKDVRAANAEAMAEVPTGQPFDLTATVRSEAL